MNSGPRATTIFWKVIDVLNNEYGRRAPNYYFNPKFKLGAWDGYIRYFQKTGKTYVYLLDDIIPQLKSLGYKIQLIDERNSDIIQPNLIDKDYFAHIPDSVTGNPSEFRPYQVEGVNSLVSNGNGIMIAGTGAGKTMMNAALVDLYGKFGLKTGTIVPTTDLIGQTKSTFIHFGLDAGEYSGDEKDLNHQHTVSTWQALQNNPSVMKQFDVIVVDECHGLKGNVLTKLLNEHGKHICYRFGLTGTLPKAETDAMAVRVAVGSVQFKVSAIELIRQNYLAKLHINIMQLEEDFESQYKTFLEENPDSKITYTKFKDSYFPEYQAEKRYLQSNEERLEWITMYIEAKRDLKKGNVFCLVDGVKFGKKLASMIEGAFFVHGKDKRKARKEIYDLFEDNDNIVVIATVNIASTGLNIKRIFNMVIIDVGKSFIRVIQSIGRGLRKAPDKDFVDVTDVCSDLKYSKSHLRQRVKFYKEAEYPYKKRKVTYTS